MVNKLDRAAYAAMYGPTTGDRLRLADTDLIKLYSGRILELASDIPLTDRLAQPDATVKKRSPLCGSTVTVDIAMENGRVTGFGQDVKACALGQASASILAAQVIGCTRDEIENARADLRALLTTEAINPRAPFEDYGVLAPAREFKNRHASIMLALDATLEAIDEAETAKNCA